MPDIETKTREQFLSGILRRAYAKAGPGQPPIATARTSPLALRVEVPELRLAWSVEQQPAPYKSVTRAEGVLSQHGNTALGALVFMAHAAWQFSLLRAGHDVKVLTAEGERRYRVAGQHSFRVWPVLPEGASGDEVRFQHLATGRWYPDASLYKSFYTGDQLAFATCIDHPQQPAWGRLFVNAYRLP